MFNFDSFNNTGPLRAALCRPDDQLLCELNGIREDTGSLTLNANNQQELSFEYDRFIFDQADGAMVESNGFQQIVVGMKIFLENKGFFKIKFPPYSYDGEKEYKSITAYSVDCELEDKDLTLRINTGDKTSLENLVEYEDGETEPLIDAYTGLPYDYIVFYNTFPEQLGKLKGKYSDGIYADPNIISEIVDFCTLIPRLKSRVLTDKDGNSRLEEYVIYTKSEDKDKVVKIELSKFNERITSLINFYTKYHNQLSLLELAIEKSNCTWTIGNIDPSLINKKFQFSVENTNVYSFLTQDVAGAAKCVFDFDIEHYKINVVLAENIGADSYVTIDDTNLRNSVEIECNNDSVCTRFNVSGGNGLDISYVNFGDNRIDDISYFIHARDENGKRIYVTDGIAEKYQQFVKDRESARKVYTDLTRQYNQLRIDIDEIVYKVPNDAVKTNWGTFTSEELSAAKTEYENMLCTLETLYKEDFGAAGCNPDGSVNANFIKNTFYWPDYYAYKQAIEQIREAIIALSNDSNYNKIEDEEILKKINAYKTEWTLYGVKELQNKIKVYDDQLKILVDKETMVLKPNSETPKTWAELTKEEKVQYGNLEINYQYEPYATLLRERNSCQSYLDTLLPKVKNLEEQQKKVHSQRTSLVKLITVRKYNRLELAKIVSLENPSKQITFNKEEIRSIELLYVDGSYSNENIIQTSIDTEVSVIKAQEELLHEAEEQLSIDSQPQISFTCDIDNLLCLPEFKGVKFNVWNYVRLQYHDDYYVTLRLESMTCNPFIPTDPLQVTFTNYITSKSKRSDISYLLGQANGSGGRSSYGSGSNGNYGGNLEDVDVTLSNTMLSKLLNSETFGTRVTDVILTTMKVTSALTAKYAKFDGLAKGVTTIDGKCITTGYIKDKLYNGKNGDISNAKGSVINLEDGKFSLAGGRLKFDGNTLLLGGDVKIAWDQVTGAKDKVTEITKNTITTDYVNALGITAKTVRADWVYAGNIKADQVKTGILKSTDGKTTIINLNNGTFSFAGDRLKWDGSKLSVNGEITATSGKIGGWNIGSSAIDYSTNAYSVHIIPGTNANKDFLVVNDKSNNTTPFFVRADGTMNASKANITGKITAASGKIGVFNINNALYTTSNSFAAVANNIYFGPNGLSLGTTFKVTNTGVLTATGVDITGNINATSGNFEHVKIYDGCLIGNFQIVDGKIIGSNDAFIYSYSMRCSSLNAKTIILDEMSLFDRFAPKTHYHSQLLFNPEVGVEVWLAGSSMALCPVTNGTTSLGRSERKYKNIYASETVFANEVRVTKVTETSDLKEKEVLSNITIPYEKFFMDLQPILYKWKNFGNELRPHDRIHCGLGAQDVYHAALNQGLSEMEVGAICRDDLSSPTIDGRTERWGLNYGELHGLEIHMIQKNYKKLDSHEERITKLEKENRELKQYIKKLGLMA